MSSTGAKLKTVFGEFFVADIRVANFTIRKPPVEEGTFS